MKNIYETPEMELIFLESEDTICTSDQTETPISENDPNGTPVI